jgi:hypothetical protein
MPVAEAEGSAAPGSAPAAGHPRRWWILGALSLSLMVIGLNLTVPYDVVSIADFPDDETATAFLLQAGSLGNVRTTTLRAFNSDEISAIISKAS